MEGESIPNRAYLSYFQREVNHLHPSCAPALPMEVVEVEDTLELEEITLARGPHDHILEQEDQQQRLRQDHDRRGQNRGDRRGDRDRHHRRERDQERGDNRRQGDRTYRTRHSNPNPNPRRN